MDRIFLAQRIWGAILGLACSFAASPVFGQYSLIQTPFNSASHSYYENIGVAWGLQGRGWFFNFGGPGPGAPPAFGGFDPMPRLTWASAFWGMA